MVSCRLKAEVGGLSPRSRAKGTIATHLVNLAIADAGSARPPVVDGGSESRWPNGTARHRREGRAARSGEGGKTAAREKNLRQRQLGPIDLKSGKYPYRPMQSYLLNILTDDAER